MARPKRFELLTPRFVVPLPCISSDFGRSLAMRFSLISRLFPSLGISGKQGRTSPVATRWRHGGLISCAGGSHAEIADHRTRAGGAQARRARLYRLRYSGPRLWRARDAIGAAVLRCRISPVYP